MIGGMVVFVSALFGLIVGSFLNVVVLRFGTGRSLGGRSGCPSCGHTLAWYELIPVFSWVIQVGRCRSCGSRISIQYPLVECATAGVFALAVYLARTPVDALVGVMAGSVLVAIAAYDIKHTIIPDRWAFFFALIGLASSLVHAWSFSDALFIVVSGPAVAIPLFTLWFISKGTWMGFGDVKLALGIGWLLGIVYGGIALYIAFVLGALISVSILLPLPYIIQAVHRYGILRLKTIHSRFTMRSEVPFGPFLVAGCMIAWGIAQTGISIPFLS